MVLRRWEVLQDNLVSSNGLIMLIPWIRSEEGLTLKMSAFESLHGSQFTLSTSLMLLIASLTQKWNQEDDWTNGGGGPDKLMQAVSESLKLPLLFPLQGKCS